MPLKPKVEEFEIGENGIHHTPTECQFICFPHRPTDGTWHDGHKEADYDPYEVKEFMRRLWAKHLAKSART